MVLHAIYYYAVIKYYVVQNPVNNKTQDSCG